MRTGLRPSPRRGGFTLIELLVVISILAILAALTLAGISRVRAGQHASTTEGTVKKIQTTLNTQLTTTIEEANSSKNQHVGTVQPYCDGDLDRTRAVLAYLYAKRDFPQSFAEARNPFPVPFPAPLPTLYVPGHKAFSQLPTSSLMPPEQQSAVLLYLIVTAKGSKGTGTTDDAFGGATGVVSFGGVDYPVFTDAYGTPIAFARWYQAAGGAAAFTNQPPYVNGNSGNRDPYDRASKLATWASSNPTMSTAVRNLLNNNSPSTVQFDGWNKVLTAWSAGADKTFGTDDDVYGFKLAQFGAKAN